MIRLRRTKKRKIGAQKRNLLRERDGDQCFYCDKEMSFYAIHPITKCNVSVEHIYDRQYSGSHDPINLVLAHTKCNSSRGKFNLLRKLSTADSSRGKMMFLLFSNIWRVLGGEPEQSFPVTRHDVEAWFHKPKKV